MRLTALLIFIVSMHVSAHGFSQTVSFKGKNVPLETVFASFEKQTGLSFFFNYALIKDIKPVTVDVREMPLEDALNIILKEQGLNFYRSGKTIFIVKQEAPAVAAPVSAASSDAGQVNVSGKVTNQEGEVLAGASVEVKNGKKSTLTDAKGVFELKNVQVGTMLVVSYTGYQKKEIEVDQSDVKVVLAVANNQLDQVQIIAYGTTSERLNTGNVTTIKSTIIAQQPVDNPLLALEGQVPGLFISQSTGVPGSGVTVRIQGQNSIIYGNDPLYVIDGVPYTSQLLPNLGGSILGGSGGPVINATAPGSGSPLSYINPADIESIDVLKDADATAIYGSRAANGAILITTKTGKVGQAKIDLNFQSGWGTVTRKLDLLNTPEYLQMRHEAISNDGLMTQQSDYDINGTWDTTRNTDWQKALIGGKAQYTDVNGSFSGGSLATQYLVGATYHRQTTVFPDNFADQKGNVHFSLRSASSNQKFHLQFSASYMIDNNRLPNSDLTSYAVTLPPDAPPPYNSDGTINWALQNGSSTWPISQNPIANLSNTYDSKTGNLIGNAILNYQILPGLEIRSSFGYTNLQATEYSLYPLSAIAPENRPYYESFAQYANNNLNSWIIEPQAEYKYVFSGSKLQALAGMTIQENNSNGEILDAYGFNSDLVLQDIQSASQITVGSTSASVYRYNAGFGRINYNYRDKYLIDLTARRDGSSRFGAANQFHDFEAIGLAWIFSNEAFIKNNLPVLSFGKFRGSYGTTGNDQIGDYQYLSLYSPTSVNVPYQGVTGLAPNGLTNPDLQWELTRKLQFGMDLGFAKERVLLTVNYNRNRSSNELLSYALPYITGFGDVSANFPALVQNTGLEFLLNTINIKTKEFTWSTRLNLTIPTNKLVSFPNLAMSSYSSALAIGQSVNIRKVFHLLGVNDTSGIYEFSAAKGGETTNPVSGTDNNVVINTMPKYYGGLENTILIKNFELDFLFQFVKQKGLNYFFGEYPGAEGLNQPTSVLSRWQKPGDITPIQRYNSNFSLFLPFLYAAYKSDGSWTDASFIRLKNLSISWNFPKAWMKGAHIDNCSLFVHAQNLITITKFKGMDPENQTVSNLPPLKVVTFGLRLRL